MPILVPIGPDVWHLSHMFVCVTPTPSKYPLGLEVNFFSRCPFPDESAYVCQFLSRSVQWFATGPSVTAKVSSIFSRCWHCLAQKHAKKQHLYIENYNSGPNMLTSTSTTNFLHGNFLSVALRGSLAEVLMVMCTHT